MRYTTVPSRPLLLVLAVLIGAALACNLTIGQGDSSRATPIPTVERPTVAILQPAEGAQFVLGQTISVQARALSASGVTQVELLANGVRVATQSPDALNATDFSVILDYTPTQAGTIVLAVQ
ncbi:MAG: hypothetical protein JXQ72_09360, partial [Anaerolineae bacterium]|nr:hypothetical protein [Anaerolineae bacterium]